LQLMKEEPLSASELQNSISVALKGCERASSLSSQLLGFSRQGKYDLRDVSVQEIARETLDFLSRVIGKSITINFMEEEEQLFVRADRAQLQQALTNLVLNAV